MEDTVHIIESNQLHPNSLKFNLNSIAFNLVFMLTVWFNKKKTTRFQNQMKLSYFWREFSSAVIPFSYFPYQSLVERFRLTSIKFYEWDFLGLSKQKKMFTAFLFLWSISFFTTNPSIYVRNPAGHLLHRNTSPLLPIRKWRESILHANHTLVPMTINFWLILFQAHLTGLNEKPSESERDKTIHAIPW